jgi:Tol biopolymer transport system component
MRRPRESVGSDTVKRLMVCLLSFIAVVGSASVAQATFPGANGTIVFAARPPGEPKSLRQIEPDGTGLGHLIPRGTGEDRAPAWSPDGTTVAFASSRSGNLDIWTVRPHGGAPLVNLTETPGADELLPTWSPAGRIAFTSQPIGSDSLTIDVMDADGSNRVSIATLNAPVSLEWSPTGARIAYSVVDAGSRDISTIRPDGSAPVRLADDLPRAVIYDFRPDGRRILFQGGSTGTNGLYEIAVGGDHHIRRLTNPAPHVLDEHASYSPNGRRIVFVRHSAREDALWLMRADGSHERVLKRFALLRAYGISWQPI